MNLYTVITNAWVAECIEEFGRTLPMNNVTENGCGHSVAEGAPSLTTRSGREIRAFTLMYNVGDKYDNTAN